MNEKLHQLQQELDDYVKKFFTEHQPADVLAGNEPSQRAYKKLSEFSQRPSKRVRGALALVSYRSFGGKSKKAALDLALALELYHSYLLIIDDVMDRSQQRRGAATIHTQYVRELTDSMPNDSEAAHVSNMLAVSVGLIAAHMSAEIMSQLDEDSDRVSHATQLLNQNMTLTGYGQLEDLLNTPYMQRSDADVLHIYSFKTSYYTFINPLVVGASLAGNIDKTVQKALTSFGLHAGIAYQLQDDIIGLYGDEKKTGKSHLDDLREGKMTVLMRRMLQQASDSQKRRIEGILGNPNANEKDRELVLTIIEDIGVLSDMRKAIHKKCVAAEASLDAKELPSSLTAFLSDLLTYTIKRER